MVVAGNINKQRILRMREAMRERELQALVIYSSPTGLGMASGSAGNVRYLTNWADTLNPSLLVLPLEAEPVLLVYAPFNIRWARERTIGVCEDIRCEEDVGTFGSVARTLLEERAVPSGRVGIVGKRDMMVPVYLGLTSPSANWQFEDADDLFAKQCLIKEPEEIQLHRFSSKILDNMFYAVMNGARVPGKWAWQLIAEMEYTARSMGAEWATGWLATGPVVDFIGGQLLQNMRQLQDDDLVLTCTYSVYEGYWAHGFRMGFKGKPTPQLKRYFDNIVDVQDAGLKELKPGNRLRDVVKAMNTRADEYCPYGKKDPLRFHPGHGLGLRYYDPLTSEAFPQPKHWSKSGQSDAVGWRSGQESTLLVQPGMILALHPNFSVPEYGIICIGDVVLVTESGAELLTKFPRDLYEI